MKDIWDTVSEYVVNKKKENVYKRRLDNLDNTINYYDGLKYVTDKKKKELSDKKNKLLIDYQDSLINSNNSYETVKKRISSLKGEQRSLFYERLLHLINEIDLDIAKIQNNINISQNIMTRFGNNKNNQKIKSLIVERQIKLNELVEIKESYITIKGLIEQLDITKKLTKK